MNVTPHITRPRLTVIISSSSENPLFLRDGISSLLVVNLVSSADVNQPNLSPKISKTQPDRENLQPFGEQANRHCLRWGSLHPRKVG